MDHVFLPLAEVAMRAVRRWPRAWFSADLSQAISEHVAQMEYTEGCGNQRKRSEIGCRQTKTASKPVKLQRPDEGRRVQSLLSRICSPAPFCR